MEKFYAICSRNVPSIYDSNTVYNSTRDCNHCKGIKSDIGVLGAYLPTFKYEFGLIAPLGGIIGSKGAIEYLRENGINSFSTDKAVVTFGKRNSLNDNEEYYRIKPIDEIELNGDLGPGSVVVCEKCNRRTWNDKEGIHIVKNLPSVDLLVIKHTWIIICSERFMNIAKKVPNKCYLTFDDWKYQLE